jgi:hypothetical protein
VAILEEFLPKIYNQRWLLLLLWLLWSCYEPCSSCVCPDENFGY